MTSADFVAGVGALLPVLTILAAGIIPVLVAIVTARSNRKNEQAKIEADKEREKMRLAHEKELAQAVADRAEAAARQLRADAEDAAKRVAATDEAARAQAVAELFFAVILYIDSQDTERDTQVFEYYFAERWPGFEVDLRRAIGGLKDGTLRNRLDSLVDSATDTEIQTFHGSSPKGWARWLSDIAADLAMTASRMEEPDGELVGRYKAFFDSYTEVYMWREDRREADRGMRRDQLRHSTQ